MSCDRDTYPLTGRFLEGRLRHVMTPEEKAQLEALVYGVEAVENGQVVVARGDHLEHSTLLVDGFMLRTICRDGRQAIVGLHVAGDFVDLHNFALKRLDHDIVALGPGRIASVRHTDLAHQLRERPRLARMLWSASLLDASIHRVWIMKLEQVQADRRIAHLFAEIWRRLEMVGLARHNGFASPLTQSHVAAMCGISTVHANRALRALRDARVAQFRRGRVFADDRAKLEAHGCFEPDYLYGEGVLHLDPQEIVG